MSTRTWSADVQAIGDRIAALTLAEAAALKAYLEEVHGVLAAAPAVVVPIPDPDKVTPPPEPTEFDVVLDGFDAAKKVAVIRVVRDSGGYGLREARDLVEGFPQVIKNRLPRPEAEGLRSALEAAGAKITLRACAA